MNAAGSRAGRRVDVDTVEERLERRVVELDVPHAVGGRVGNLERPAVEALVELAHSRAVEEQDLQRVASPRVEDEERATPRVIADLIERNPGQPIKRVPVMRCTA